jgi:hypothetical protein
MLPCLSNAVVQLCNHVSKVAALSAAMSQHYSSVATSPKWLHSVLPCLSVTAVQPHLQSTAMQPRLGIAAMFRHLKIGWFRVIKGDGLGDSPLAYQHQLMNQ